MLKNILRHRVRAPGSAVGGPPVLQGLQGRRLKLRPMDNLQIFMKLFIKLSS